MSKQQTAVEWLWQQMLENDVHELEELVGFFITARQMEREQIAKAFDDSVFRFDDDISAEQYYKETYGGEDE